MGHDVEKQVQGAASPTDTYVSTMGGVFEISKKRKLNPIECGIVIGNTNKDSPTGELVAGVSELKEAYPDIISPILSLMGKMSDIGEELVSNADYVSIGELMNVNQGLLDAIGVGGPELSSLVYSARSAGAYGAKITGAGGGGCMVALADVSRTGDVAGAITGAGGDAIVTSATEQGVKLETGI
jgi:mevalonate kinase